MAATKAASRQRGAAARSEVNGKHDSTEIKLSHRVLAGLKITGPKVLPATFSWDYAEVQALARDEDDSIMGTFYHLIVSVIGREQANMVRSRIADKAPATTDAGMEMMSTILTDIINAYGTTEGE